MALTDMAFSPADGLNNATSYPSAPGSGAAARAQVQGRLNELRDFINNTQKIEITENKFNYATSTTGSDTYVVTITNIATYAAGLEIFMLADVANTGAATININTLGAIAIRKNGTNVLEDGDIPAGAIALLKHDGTYFQLLNPAKTTALTTHVSATTGIHGVGASTVESVAGSQTKVDTHNSNTTTAHGAVSTATANKIIIRDAAGRAKVVAPSAEDDIALKSNVTTVQTNLTNHTGTASSETVVGHVELATAAETTTGTDNTRAVHPAGLKVELDKKANLAGATMTGVLTCRNATDYTTKQARNITLSTSDASGGGNGDVWLKYV